MATKRETLPTPTAEQFFASFLTVKQEYERKLADEQVTKTIRDTKIAEWMADIIVADFLKTLDRRRDPNTPRIEVIRVLAVPQTFNQACNYNEHLELVIESLVYEKLQDGWCVSSLSVKHTDAMKTEDPQNKFMLMGPNIHYSINVTLRPRAALIAGIVRGVEEGK